MNNAMGVLETTEAVGTFLCECYKYWVGEGKAPREAIELAIEDADGITSDPFSPQGRLLDDEAAKETVNIWRNLMYAQV